MLLLSNGGSLSRAQHVVAAAANWGAGGGGGGSASAEAVLNVVEERQVRVV